MSERKRLVDLVLDGTFRRDRHELLLGFDESILGVLEAVDAGKAELAASDVLKLEWAWDWQAALRDRVVHPDVFWFNWAQVVRGVHPPRLPYPDEGDAA